MTNQQQRLVLSRSVEPHDQILFAIIGTENPKVGLGESRITKALRHRLGSRRHAAHGIGGVNLDQLLEDVVREFAGGVVDLRLRRGNEKRDAQEKRTEQSKPFAAVQWVSLAKLNQKFGVEKSTHLTLSRLTASDRGSAGSAVILKKRLVSGRVDHGNRIVAQLLLIVLGEPQTVSYDRPTQ